jgi:hypothetical protein
MRVSQNRRHKLHYPPTLSCHKALDLVFSVPFAHQEVKRDITVVSIQKENAILFLS